MGSAVKDQASVVAVEVEGAGVALVDRQENARHFDHVYREAHGDPSKVRWADEAPCPSLVAWLNAEAPGLIRPGASVGVVGCGLGDDAAELAARGYEVSAFDVSTTAVDWAKRRFPAIADRFHVADLLALPDRLRRRFDLVVEVYTLQSLHPSMREDAAAGVCGLARPKGVVLTICRGREEQQPLSEISERPYPLCASELLGLMEAQGWGPIHGIDEFYDEGSPPTLRLRGVFRRG